MTTNESIADSIIAESERREVKRWTNRVLESKRFFEADLKRIKANMEFAAGFQWDGQAEMDSEEYVINITLRNVHHKAATLYARNPQVDVLRRERLDFVIWDERYESLITALGKASQAAVMGGTDMEAEATLLDYQQGKQWRDLVNRICRSVKIAYQYQTEAHKPDFKEQMKQMVRRTIICGVSYVRPIFVREVGEASPTSMGQGTTAADRARLLGALADKVAEEGEDSANVETMRSLAHSLSVGSGGESSTLEERLEFDFPPPNTIIVDSRCRNLKEFVAARWVAQEYMLPLDDVNAMFGTDIEEGGDLTIYNERGQEERTHSERDETKEGPYVCVWEVMDKVTQTHFYICDGWHGYLRPPMPMDPPVKGFWQVQALTFNDVEADPDTKASIYPPSDVQLVKHPQKEWNRSRDAWRDQRNANAPIYPIRKGMLTENDKALLTEHEPNSVIELEGIPSDKEPAQFLRPMIPAPMDPQLYDNTPLTQDIQLSTGAQEANLGPHPSNFRATVGNIAEQSRLTVSSSNVDDLDGVLTRLAQSGVEMLLRSLSPEVARRIVGRGCVWPGEDRDDYINEIIVKIVAASSGRPNKALDVANYERVAPIMINAGANPIAVIEEGVKRLDDQLEVSRFFPTPGGMGTAPLPAQPAPAGAKPPGQRPGSKPNKAPAKPGQPLQRTAAVAPPVPLPGA